MRYDWAFIEFKDVFFKYYKSSIISQNSTNIRNRVCIIGRMSHFKCLIYIWYWILLLRDIEIYLTLELGRHDAYTTQNRCALDVWDTDSEK